MVLLQISEPGQSPEPHQHRRAIGIDLGTTNSLVATVLSGTPTILEDEQQRSLLPSVVHYAEDGEVLLGFEARDKALGDPQNTLFSVKRFMGRGVQDIERLGSELPYEMDDSEKGMPRFVTRAGKVSPVSVSAKILEALENRAESALGGYLDGAVITVPAYFDDAQRQATRDAATLAGLKVLRLLNEPTAAAIAYGLDKQDGGVIAVYDLGGGTFDISVLRLSGGVFEVLATGGDSSLGGDDFDRAIAEWLRDQAGLPESLSVQQQRELMELAQQAKERLTETEQLELSFGPWRGSLDRTRLAKLVDPLIDSSVRACKRTLRDAGISIEEINNVVLVGGSTRMPRVREKVFELFGREPLANIDPDRVVALGAAIQADILVGNKPDSDLLLLDVIPLSLGLETMGGLTEKIIHRNTTIPVAKAQEFTTYKDGQTAMSIHVLQGERELVADNRSLAHFELKGIPPMAAGAAKVRVKFQVDADGLLNVEALEMTSGVAAHIEVKPSYGLSDEEVTNMLRDSYTHAKDDMQLRALREQQVEADRLCEDVEAALKADGRELLTDAEYHCLEVALNDLRAIRDSSDHRLIARHIEMAAKASEEFAAKRMDKSIKRALSGHRLEEFDQE